MKGWFGAGKRALVSAGHSTPGVVTQVKECRWLKVNTKPVRRNSLDGAVFLHRIFFQYSVDGVSYRGSRFVNWNLRCPGIGERVTVYFDPNAPQKHTVSLGIG